MIKTTIYPLIQNSNFFEEMDKILQSSFKTDTSYPPYNIYEEDGETFIEIGVSGFKKEDIKTYIDDEGLLCIEGSREKTDRSYIHKGLSTKNFQKKFHLDKNQEVNEVSMKDGLITVQIKETEPNIKMLSIK